MGFSYLHSDGIHLPNFLKKSEPNDKYLWIEAYLCIYRIVRQEYDVGWLWESVNLIKVCTLLF